MATETHTLGAEIHKHGAETHKLGAETHKHGAETHKHGAETHKLGAETHELLATLPAALQGRLSGAVPRGAGARALIIDLCAVRAFSRAELALLLRRKDVSHLSRQLAELVADGVVEMTIPNTPNAPQQAYRTRPRTSQ